MKLHRVIALALALVLPSSVAFGQVSPGTSPLTVVKGGTGSATAAGARSNLKLDQFTGQGNSNYSILATDRVVGTNAAFTASRTWTLPAANAVNAGQSLIVADFQGTVTGSNTLIIARAGSDTINGGTSVTINSASGAYLLISDGSSKWTAQAIGAAAASGVSSLDGATGAITAQAGSFDVVSGVLSGNVLSSRTFAATQNLSGFNVIRTLGYASAGDGGGATFKNVGSALFTDSHVLTGTISNAGSSYTPGFYGNVQMSGGVGFDLYLNITVGGGGTITTVTVAQQGGYGYAVGNVMTTSNGNIGGTGSGFTWTVATVSTPSASFTDSAGNRWQYVVDEGNFINVKQFGAKFDFAGTDGSATNDRASIQAAINFAANRPSSINPHGLGGSDGSAVYLARGSSLVCGALTVWRSVSLRGQGMFNTDLKLCDSGLSASDHFLTICDPTTLLACFAANIQDFTLTATTSAAANTGIAMIRSNSVQQSIAIKSVAVYAGLRECFRYTNGYGGAAKVDIYDFFCTMFTASSNNGIVIDPTTTVNMMFWGLIVEAGGSGSSLAAVIWNSGNLFINGFHTEGVATGIAANATVANYAASLHGATGGVGCTELVLLQSTNTHGNFVIGTSQLNGCTRLITNGQAGGANFSSGTVKSIVCAPGNPCAP